MNKIIETVSKDIRPKEGFACANCPFSAWRSGEFKTLGRFEKNEFLDCYCHKFHLYVYKSIEVEETDCYQHIEHCSEKTLAINEVLEED